MFGILELPPDLATELSQRQTWYTPVQCSLSGNMDIYNNSSVVRDSKVTRLNVWGISIRNFRKIHIPLTASQCDMIHLVNLNMLILNNAISCQGDRTKLKKDCCVMRQYIRDICLFCLILPLLKTLTVTEMGAEGILCLLLSLKTISPDMWNHDFSIQGLQHWEQSILVSMVI